MHDVIVVPHLEIVVGHSIQPDILEDGLIEARMVVIQRRTYQNLGGSLYDNDYPWLSKYTLAL